MFRNLIFFIKSFFFFLTTFFKTKKYDILFYYPQHFNRSSSNENSFFRPLLNTCDTNKIKYIIFEEPDYNIKNKRNSNAIPFDFAFIFIILLRKIYYYELDLLNKDRMIGNILSKTLFFNIKFNHVITISQSMLSIFRGLSENISLYDLQHGIIHKNKSNYIVNNTVHPNLMYNNVNLLLFGESFKQILVSNESSNYFISHAFIIGSYIKNKRRLHNLFNNNVLVTLQFTRDHSVAENALLLDELEAFLFSEKNINFYLKHHPRFNNEVDISKILKYDNIHIAPSDISTCFQLCSLHATTYSSSTFDAAILGIPTVLIDSKCRFDVFRKHYCYPLDNNISYFANPQRYQESVSKVLEWSMGYYSNYEETDFLKLFK